MGEEFLILNVWHSPKHLLLRAYEYEVGVSMPFAEGKFAWACEFVSVKVLNRYGSLTVKAVAGIRKVCVAAISSFIFTVVSLLQ